MRSEQIIRAGRSGYIAIPNVEVGQQVDPSKLLLSIVPERTELYAHLYIPSSAAGFIKPKDKVVLRYQAYPYQKFGLASGSVVSVAKDRNCRDWAWYPPIWRRATNLFIS